MTPRDVDPLFPVGRVAKMLGCHPKTIDRLVARTTGNPFPSPTCWIGSRRLWAASTIQAWLAAEQERPRRFTLPRTQVGEVAP